MVERRLDPTGNRLGGLRIFTVLLVGSLFSVGPRAFAGDQVPLPDEPAVQSDADALQQDLALIARAQGWSDPEAATYFASERALGEVAARIAAERPLLFVGSELSRSPGGSPKLYVKGDADELVKAIVRESGFPITIVDGQPYSFSELEERKRRVHDAALEAGFEQVVTGFDFTRRGLITITVAPPAGTHETPESILAILPHDLRSEVEVAITEDSLFSPDGAFGGMWFGDAQAVPPEQCTSGWTVRKLNSILRGVTTAGHCAGIDHIIHPGHGQHSAALQSQHEGQWGDVEWYTTPEFENDDFYADAITVRDVTAVEPRAAISLNEFICVYGQASNDRDCSLYVTDVSNACGPVLDRLVTMSGDTSSIGDSGGGWSLATTAYGGHYGPCLGLDSFTVADLFDEAIGVWVPTS